MPVAPTPQVVKLKDSHHRMARLFAAGLRDFEIAELTGYSPQRVMQLRHSRPMDDLVARYKREVVDEAYRKEVGGYYENAMKARDIAMRQMLDQLEMCDETGEYFPPRTLSAIHADLADRTGYGKRSTQVNVNVDFAAQLDKAIARSREVGAVPHLKLVESSPVPPRLEPPRVERPPSFNPVPIKRRI